MDTCAFCEYFDGGGELRVRQAQADPLVVVHGDCHHHASSRFTTDSTDTCALFSAAEPFPELMTGFVLGAGDLPHAAWPSRTSRSSSLCGQDVVVRHRLFRKLATEIGRWCLRCGELSRKIPGQGLED